MQSLPAVFVLLIMYMFSLHNTTSCSLHSVSSLKLNLLPNQFESESDHETNLEI